MWGLDYKESWALKNWCFWTVVLEKTLESLLDCKEIKPVNSKGSQSWIFIGRTDANAEAPVLWLPDVKSYSLVKTLMLGKIEGRRRRGWQRIRWLMASPTQWTWVWVNSRSWWWTGRPGVLQSMGSQRVGHDWVTELNWRCLKIFYILDIQITLLFKSFTLGEGTYYMNVTIAQTFLNIFSRISLKLVYVSCKKLVKWYTDISDWSTVFQSLEAKTKSLKTILYFKHKCKLKVGKSC